MTKKDLFIWVCDFSENSGEGKLARLFIKDLNSKEKFQIKLNQIKKLNLKYLTPFLGIIFCWVKFLQNKKVCYLNYLPLWNFFIFMLLPPKTILGPITGGANFVKSNIIDYLLRGIIFSILYRISGFFLYIRVKKPIFSTSLLKDHLTNKQISKSEFNFCFKNLKFKKKVIKKYDLVIYHRKHYNKSKFFPNEFIKKMADMNFKIAIIGDHLNINSVKNFEYKKNSFVNNIQSQSNYTIASGENLYSFFTLECISNNVIVLVDKTQKNLIKYYKKKIRVIDFKNINYISVLKKLKKIK